MEYLFLALYAYCLYLDSYLNDVTIYDVTGESWSNVIVEHRKTKSWKGGGGKSKILGTKKNMRSFRDGPSASIHFNKKHQQDYCRKISRKLNFDLAIFLHLSCKLNKPRCKQQILKNAPELDMELSNFYNLYLFL